MESYFKSSRLTNLRYATPAGLEQSHNGTASGPRVLKRDFYGTGTKQTSCLVTYLSDGLTKLDEGYEDCHYDPRYEDWYTTGREIRGSGANETEVSAGAVDESSADRLCKVVGTLYEIWGTDQLGMGVVSKAESGAFAGGFTPDSYILL